MKEYYRRYKINNKNQFTINDKIQIFETFQEDIFLAEASLFFKFIDDEKEKKEILKKISSYEGKLADSIPKENLYYTKFLNYNFNVSTASDEYKALKIMDCTYINRNRRYSGDSVIEHILKIINVGVIN